MMSFSRCPSALNISLLSCNRLLNSLHFRSSPLDRTSFAIRSSWSRVLISASSSLMVDAAEAWSATASSTSSNSAPE